MRNPDGDMFSNMAAIQFGLYHIKGWNDGLIYPQCLSTRTAVLYRKKWANTVKGASK